jgi:Flagellar biosynthesis/type III secretory pathway lipoprotein
MTERLKQIPVKALEFWNKYTSKQKTIIISVISIIFLAIALLVFFLSRTQYGQLASFQDTKDTSALIQVLDDKGIKHKESTNGKIVYVDKKNMTDAILAMNENNIPSSGMSWDDALKNDMSTTETEKNQKFTLAAQNTLRQNLLNLDGVTDAVVYINQPVDDYTILSEKKEPSVSVMLTLSKAMTASQAESVATWLATSVGCSNTDNIRIIDSDKNLLFGGNSDSVLGGNISNKEDYKEKLRNTINQNVEAVLIKYGYNDAEIGSSNIQFNMDKITEMSTKYTPATGQEQGLYKSSYNYKTTGNSGSSASGIPGTSSNSSVPDYQTQDGTTTNSTTTLDKYDYLPNQAVKNIEYETGAVEPNKSSMAIVVTTYKIYNEDEMKKLGQLKGTNFDKFMAANSTRKKTAVNAEVKKLVSLTTGIPQNSIIISAWEQPIFQASQSKLNISNYLMIVLAILIVALLIFVVIKGTAPVEVTELEPELSVEQLLATTKENQSLDDIEFSEKSETRKLIEKFVDENPDAVAQLLRNWLNDDWG